MLYEFVSTNRERIIARTEAMAAKRGSLRTGQAARKPLSGVALFIDQLVTRLRDEKPSTNDLAASAAIQGEDMQHQGCTVAQVVQGYGDVCQVVIALSIEHNLVITNEDFQTLNRCLDTATAEAVSAYERERDRAIAEQGTERLGFLAHELRNKLNSAMMSFDALKKGSVGVSGSTAAILGRSLSGLRDLIDRALIEVRLESGVMARERVRLWKLIEELEIVASFEANKKGLKLLVTTTDDDAEVEVDRHVLSSAVGNLLQNAFKFTHANGQVTLKTHVAADRVLIDVEDECGGLPPGSVETLFRPFEQRGTDRSGLGLGLAISRRGVEANGGKIRVRDLPGKGCVFTVDLPRAPALGRHDANEEWDAASAGL